MYLMQNIRWLHRLQSALHVWFKKEYKWWYCIELGRRFLLLLMVVPFPGNQVSFYTSFINYKYLHILFIVSSLYYLLHYNGTIPLSSTICHACSKLARIYIFCCHFFDLCAPNSKTTNLF